MRIAIIGAGIAGVCTAYELAADGHQVTVFDRCGSVAAEGSFANAGIIAPALRLPWVAAGWPSLSAGRGIGWQLKRRRAAKDKDASATQQRLFKLAQFSLERLQALRRTLQLDYERSQGQLVLLRTARELKQVQPGLDLLEQFGARPQLLDSAQCLALEPGLNPEQALQAGVHLPQAEVGNCRQFAHLLRLEAQRLGTQFRFHTTVRSITPGKQASLVHEYTPPIEQAGPASRPGESMDKREAGDTRPATPGPQQDSFDAIVVCAGTGASELLASLGLKLATTRLHACSITAPLRQLEAHPHLGPQAALLDQQSGVSISRLGQRVRLSLSGKFSGEIEDGQGQIKAPTTALLHKVLNDWFPGSMQSGQVLQWTGSQVHLADELPVLGDSGRTGIWLNLAQESSALAGWTLACGAAAVLRSQIGGQQAGSDIPDISGLEISRLG
ncbi:amino acid dehydrogenase [Paucibacter sp. KBW04]|uniref:FAD-dependent oxidoreductase n=1 Tax=Paucibacter sp. KBW04 TaxID=2153361 RepID=UPI000F58D288|nr:FAD-dependent oxidoreductase [Paucibacter sp. KBW04]RQO63201.1 amino acid dehydrogenase [Paucibacter sp. KBW04]